MKLRTNDTINILRSFPKIKLSYIKTIYKKVSSANLYYLIPKGTKHFAWFRYFKNKECCLLMEIGKGNSIKNIKIINCCFKSELCYKKGTIVYGTLFKKNNINFFSIEDIFYYKNINFSESTLQNKLKCIDTIFQIEIKQMILNNNDTVFGLPIMSTSRETIEKYFNNPPYQFYTLQHRYNNNNNTYFNEYIKNYEKVFLVKPHVINDIYKLYVKNKKESLIFYKYALIPNYKKSVFMNNIFRNIKENINLDFLEESDSEDDFENIDNNKYIKLDEQKMICEYNIKHKLWVPKEITNLELDFEHNIISIEKNNS